MKMLFLEPAARAARAACLLACLSLLALNAHAWWQPEWTNRKLLELDPASGLALTGSLAEPTVLVRLHQGNFPQFLSVRDGGADLRFLLGDDKTPLPYQVEQFDPITQIGLVWVKLPSLTAAGERLYLYYGNGAAVRAEEAGASYDAATAAVFHFNEREGLPVDSTAYQTAVTSGEALPNPASLIGSGASLPGTQALVLADTGPLSATAAEGWTLSSWLRMSELPTSTAYVLDRQSGGTRLSLLVEGGQWIARYGETEVVAAMPVAAGQWTHVAVVVSGTELVLYVNGTAAGNAAIAAVDMTGPVSVGGASTGGGLLSAEVDELKISRVARSAEWVRFEWALQGEQHDAVVKYGGDEQAGAAGEGESAKGGYFGVIFQHVFGTKDAVVEQVVIGVCAVMALLALLVMFSKALFLSRARRASQRFLQAYAALPLGSRGEGELMSLLGQARRYGRSPLFQVYRQALLEVRKRVSPGVGAASVGLDEKALGSIRASMDAVRVRQQQRMNAFMVLLTIAISGGPFIGLFGTVVGVMVTFAAIAASGDVNINAIAPGMAAALLATVAGLGVAIPSLFGYNYLGSQVKALSADMEVYADELTARLVEEYGA